MQHFFIYLSAIYIDTKIETFMTIFDIKIVYEQNINKKSLKIEIKELKKEVGKK